MTELIAAGRRDARTKACAALCVVLCALVLLLALAPRQTAAQEAPAASDAEIADLVEKLEDPAQREQLIRELKALRAADEAAQAPREAPVGAAGVPEDAAGGTGRQVMLGRRPRRSPPPPTPPMLSATARPRFRCRRT